MLKILKFALGGVLVSCFTLLSTISFALELTIKDAEQVAIQNDPLIIQYQAKSAAFMENAVAENNWPDPKVKFGLLNVPITSFSFTDEPMTQIQIGVQQAIPPSGLLTQKQEKMQLMAEI